jgi:antitoxin component YwqK of YwqJK toxin-antitoxin module
MRFLMLLFPLFLLGGRSSSKDKKANLRVVDTTYEYYPTGQKWTTTIKVNGVSNGPYIALHKNGSIQTKGLYKNGHFVDSVIEFYPNGNINNLFVYDSLGNLNGFFRIWYDNGNLRQSGSNVMGKWNGLLSMYYKSGVPFIINNFKNDNRVPPNVSAPILVLRS